MTEGKDRGLVVVSCPSTLYAGCTMRRKVTRQNLDEFMRELARAARSAGKVYLTGGATALLLGFREQTVDIDIKLDPEPTGAFEAIAELKNRLDVNVELASPADFIPAPENWRERSRLIATYGKVEFLHFDLVLQALAKIERGHEQDLRDAQDFVGKGHMSVAELRKTFEEIKPRLLRYPAINAKQFEAKVVAFLKNIKA